MVGTMNALDEWAQSVATALGLTSETGDRELVLDLARDVAHGVMRPAAPFTAYLLGVAVGRGADPATAAATITEMTKSWPHHDET